MLPSPGDTTSDVSRRVNGALNQVKQLTTCRSTMALAEILLNTLRPFGVETYAIWTAANPERVDPLASMLSNWPDEWLSIYMANRQYLCDPIVLESVRRPGNFFWRDIAKSTASVNGELFKKASQFGMIDGFTISSRMQWPVVTALSLSGRELFWNDLEEGFVSMIANTFMSRSMYLRSEVLIPAFKALSGQERRILESAAQGISDKAIAHELGIRRGTVWSHWERIREKLDARDRAQSVAVAIWSGQIVLPPT